MSSYDMPSGLAGAMGGGPPPTIPDPGAAADQGESDASTPEDALRDAIADFQKAMELEQDDIILAQIHDLSARAQKILADLQKQQDAATGTGAPAQVMRRQQANSGGA